MIMKAESKGTNSNSNIVIKSSFWYTLSSFLTKAIVFITTPIFARVLSTEQFGNFHIFANWQSTLIIISGLEVYSTVNRARFDYTDENSLNSYISSCLVLSTIMSTIMLLIYLAFDDFFNKLFLMDRGYVVLMFAYLFTRPAFEMFQAEQRIRYRYKLSAAISFFSAIFTSLLALFLACVMTQDRLLGRIIGQYVPYMVLGLVFYSFYLFKSHTISLKKIRYAIKIAIPLVFSYLGSQILLSSDKVVVQHLSSAEAVAYLGISTSCSNIMLIFVQCLNSAWQPWFYDNLATENYEEIQEAFKPYLKIVFFCSFGALLIGPELVSALGGRNYAPALALVPPNMLSGAFTLIFSQYAAFETFNKKPQYAAIIVGITAIINIVLDIVGVKRFGYLAASYVTVICYIILILLHITVTNKLGMTKIFSIKNIMLEIILLLVMIPCSMLLYQNTIIRYIVVALYCIIFMALMFKNKKMILGLIRKG